MEPLEGYQVEAEAGHAVALALELDDELRREGLAREIVHAVQNARRDAGLEVTDRIALALGGDAELLDAARAHEDYVAGETLATAVATTARTADCADRDRRPRAPDRPWSEPARRAAIPLAAVIFDLDGVLIDSERSGREVREELTRELGRPLARPGAQQEMMGMSSTEWSRYMRDSLGVPMEPDEISAARRRTAARADYRRQVPLLPDAVETVRALAERWPLGLASSANRPLIDLVLELTGSRRLPGHGLLRGGARAESRRRTSTSRRRGGWTPTRPAAPRSRTPPTGSAPASAAGMRVVVVPRPDFPPSAEALELADAVLDSAGRARGMR